MNGRRFSRSFFPSRQASEVEIPLSFSLPIAVIKIVVVCWRLETTKLRAISVLERQQGLEQEVDSYCGSSKGTLH